MPLLIRGSSSSKYLPLLRTHLHSRSQCLYLPLSTQSLPRYTTKSSTPLPYKPPPSSKRTVAVTPTSSPEPSVPISSALTIPPSFSLKLNPPASTLPPHLELPTREPSQSAPSYYFRLGKAYLSFYRTGLKGVYTNWKLSKPLRARLPSPTGRSPSAVLGLKNGVITRAEFHLLRRTQRDILRIPLFALVFLACGEFTPLVVIFMSNVVPRTCWIPKQIHSARQKMEERRRLAFRSGSISALPDSSAPTSTQNEKNITLHIAQSLSLYPSWWDRIGFQPMFLIRGRVQKRLEELEADDAAIRQEGGVEGLNTEEVTLAAEDRGLDVLGKSDKEVRKVVGRWVGNKERNRREMLVVRPNSWDGR